MYFFYYFYHRVTEILGYRPVDLLGKLCYEFYGESDQDYMMESFDQGMYDQRKTFVLSVKYFKSFNPLYKFFLRVFFGIRISRLFQLSLGIKTFGK